MKILGISAFYHDSSAALVVDGKIVAAAQEERFTRIKHDKSYPRESINFCLDFNGLSLEDIDYVCFYEKPMMKLDRLIKTHIAFAPYGYLSFKESMTEWLTGKIFLKNQIISELRKLSNHSNWEEKLVFSEHHLSHAASAFYPSPFERSAILTMDGVGEWATTSLGVGNGNNIEIIKEHFILPQSNICIVPGFIGYDENHIITLGRGGSDLTATILARVFDIKLVILWTDISGVLPVDPKYIILSPIKTITYNAMKEFAYFGAKIVYSRCSVQNF